MALPNTFNSNTPQPAPVTDVGLKISKPGYNAVNTAGQNFIFNSSWPSLPIAFETVIDNPITSSSSTATIAHNLGFSPFTFVWAYYPDPSGVGNVCKRFTAIADTQNVYLTGSGGPSVTVDFISTPPVTATKLKICCFLLDLRKDIDYTLAPGDTFNLPYDPNYGIKIVKDGKDITSKDMRDFILHSRCQSPLILAVKTEQTMVANQIQTGPSTYGPTNVVQYKSNLPNPTWSYGFVRMTSSQTYPHAYYPAPMYAQANPRTFSDGFTTYVDFDNYEGATVVVLRDPMFAPNAQTVQY